MHFPSNGHKKYITCNNVRSSVDSGALWENVARFDCTDLMTRVPRFVKTGSRPAIRTDATTLSHDITFSVVEKSP